MEGPQRINELLANGYFKTSTSRVRSPSGSTPTSAKASSFLQAHEPETPRQRSRIRGPRGPPPPRPTVEDELVSLARESSASPIPTYDPPLRGKIDQNPILLEADVTAAEAARLHEIPCSKDKDDNGERRFVLVPKSDTYEPNEKDEIVHRKEEIRNNKAAKHEQPRHEQRREEMKESRPSQEPWREERKDSRRSPEPRREERKELRPIIHQDSGRGEEEFRRRTERTESGRSVQQEPQRKEERRESARPPIERRRSRKDLPALETKVPREIPPQFRRSTSAYSSVPRDNDETPKAPTPRGSAGDYFLSPEIARGTKETQSSSAPRQQVHDLLWGKSGTPATEKRGSGGGTSRPGTPNSESRNSDSGRNEKMTRPQQLSEGLGARKSDRYPSLDRSGRSSRSSTHRGERDYYSSEDDIAPDSDVEKHRRKNRQEHSHLQSPSTTKRPTLPGSRRTSPLPSPKVSQSQIFQDDELERRETFPPSRDSRRPCSRPASPHSLDKDKDTPRGNLLNPFDAAGRPKSRHSSTTGSPTPPPPAHHASLPIAIPSRIDLSTADSRRSPSVPQFDENRPAVPRPQPASWQPPSFQPPSQNLNKPVGSFRRYSEDIESGSIAPLPSCPRTSFTRGRNDWLTLPQCPSFDICPSCFNSTIAPTEYKHLFVPAPSRSPDTEVLCDFGSSPWYRIAWLLTVKERRRDLKLFYGLANIASSIPPCLGKHEAVRTWHSMIDPKTGGLVRGFDVCYSCVKSIETLLPAIRGVFVRTESHSSAGSPRVCDLRFDSKRFVQYFDALETAADRADYDNAPPDTRALASLVKRLAAFDECRQDADLIDRKWHIITQLPEFTVCEECFDEVVWPELDEEKAIPMMFNKTLQRIPKASCQLYSSKMRGIFRLASDIGDYKMLASKVRERKKVELEYKANIAELRRQRNGNPGVEREMNRLEEEWRQFE